MAIEGVPWFPGQAGADVSAEVARLLAYGLGHGVLSPDALKVSALPTPGAAVRLTPGPAAIEHRGVGGAFQAYIARGVTATDVAIAATGSSGGRTDLVVLRVEDPTMVGEGWQVPADVANGPYVYARVIPNVPTGTTELSQVAGYEGQTAVTLARVTLPANTATVTAAMITDLREIASPFSVSRIRSIAGPSTPNVNNSTTLIRWPDFFYDVTVPKRAVWVHLTLTLAGVLHTGGNTEGSIQLYMNGRTMGGALAIDYDQSSNGQRHTIIVTGSLYVDPSEIGKLARFEARASRSASPGRIQIDSRTHMLYEAYFEERIR